MDNNKLIGERIAIARENLKMGQQEMADKLAAALKRTYSRRHYQDIEAGKFPKYKKAAIIEIDKILGTNFCEEIYEQNVPRKKIDHVALSGDTLAETVLNNQAKINVAVRMIIKIWSEQHGKDVQEETDIFNDKLSAELSRLKGLLKKEEVKV